MATPACAELDLANNMPKDAAQQMWEDQLQPLSTERKQSSIPKGGTAGSWIYPSPQMFYNGAAAHWPRLSLHRLCIRRDDSSSMSGAPVTYLLLLYGGLCMRREVAKAVRLRKACTVVVAPNIEHIEAEGGLDDLLTSILTQAEASSIPVVFALSRKKLGQVWSLAAGWQHGALLFLAALRSRHRILRLMHNVSADQGTNCPPCPSVAEIVTTS